MKRVTLRTHIRLGFRLPAPLWVLAIALCLAAARARAGDDGNEDALRQILRQYETVNAELRGLIREMDDPQSISDMPERMLSPRRNASVTVGGEFRQGIIASRGNFPVPGGGDSSFGDLPLGKTRTTDFSLLAARLRIDARLPNRWRLHADFNLRYANGFQDVRRVTNTNHPGDADPDAYRYEEDIDGYVHEAYVEFLKNGHSGFGFRAGLVDLPFGLESRPNLIGRSFLDAPNLTASHLMNPYSKNDAALLPHASRFIDPVVAALVNYELRDIVRFEGGIFQDREGARKRRTGTGSYRSEASAFLSYQIGFSVLPLEGWELSAVFRNRHSRTRGIRHWADSPYRTDFMQNLAGGGRDPSWEDGADQWSDAGTGPAFGSRRNEQAFTVGVAVEIPDTRLAVQLEYARGWNQGFNRHIFSDNVNLGLSYRLTPRLTLHGQAEWLRVKDGSWLSPAPGGWSRNVRTHNLHRFLLGAEYELLRGLTMEAGWQYEHWDSRSLVAADRRTLTATALYLGSRFIF